MDDNVEAAMERAAFGGEDVPMAIEHILRDRSTLAVEVRRLREELKRHVELVKRYRAETEESKILLDPKGEGWRIRCHQLDLLDSLTVAFVNFHDDLNRKDEVEG